VARLAAGLPWYRCPRCVPDSRAPCVGIGCLPILGGLLGSAGCVLREARVVLASMRGGASGTQLGPRACALGEWEGSCSWRDPREAYLTAACAWAALTLGLSSWRWECWSWAVFIGSGVRVLSV
jgi:hypothetical protein